MNVATRNGHDTIFVTAQRLKWQSYVPTGIVRLKAGVWVVTILVVTYLCTHYAAAEMEGPGNNPVGALIKLSKCRCKRGTGHLATLPLADETCVPRIHHKP